MMMKPVDPNAVIRDPHTRRAIPVDGGNVPDNSFWARRWLAGETWKLEGKVWVRRLPDGKTATEPYVEPAPSPELKPETTTEPAKPTGREPVQSLTTREGK